MNSQPQLSVIIPTFKRPEYLKQCIEALSPKNQSLPHDSYELIITDDDLNSTHNEWLGSIKNAKWVQGPGRGPCANRNNGTRHAKNELLVFLDDDCIPSSTPFQPILITSKTILKWNALKDAFFRLDNKNAWTNNAPRMNTMVHFYPVILL